MPPVLLDRDAAWGRSLLPNERIQLSRLAPEVAADAAPNRDAAFFGLLSSPTTVATGSHPSNHTTTDSGTNVAMGALATTNDDDDDADKNCKQARH